jgi:glutathione S-transferase
MSMGEVLLLDCWVSPFCMRAKIALNEKGVAYETQAEDLFGGKSELLLTSNPVYQKVPVLLHEGKPVSESTIIVSYIDETWSSPPLLPACAYGKSQARFWADFINKKVFDTGAGIWRGSGEAVQVAVKDFVEILKQLEGALGGKSFFGGDTFGFVDIILMPLTCWFLAYEKFGSFTVEQVTPKLTDWIKRCMQRESVGKVIPDPEKVYEFVVMFRKMQGIK